MTPQAMTLALAAANAADAIIPDATPAVLVASEEVEATLLRKRN